MSPEEKERFKEKEKAHLRELIRLKRIARQARRTGAVGKALGEITGATERALTTQDEMASRLMQEAALSEARLEIALENAPESVAPSVDITATPRPEEAGSPAAEDETPPATKTKTIGPHLHSRTSDNDAT